MASKFICDLSEPLPPSWLNNVLPVHLQTESIIGSKCAQPWPPCSSQNLLDQGVQIHTIMASNCISQLTWSWPPSSSPTLFDQSVQVRTVTASKGISILAYSRPSSPSLSVLNLGLQVHCWVQSIIASIQVHLQTCSMTETNSISMFTQTVSPCASPIKVKNHRQLGWPYVCISIDLERYCMPYYDVANHHIIVTKTDMIDKLTCGFGTLRTTAVRIQHQVSCRDAQRYHQLFSKSPADLCSGLSCSKIWLSYKSSFVASSKHLHNFRYFQMHLGMLLQELRAFSLAPGGSGSVWNYLEALVRLTGVSGILVCSFRTVVHFADVEVIILRTWRPRLSNSWDTDESLDSVNSEMYIEAVTEKM